MTPRPDIKRIEAAGSAGAVAGDTAEELASFLIAKAPDLAMEFAAGRTDAAQPAPPTSPAWMRDADILTTNDGAVICGVGTTAAVLYRCDKAREDGFPIDIYVGGARLLSRQLLLANIERIDGKPARLEAESRAEKLPKFGVRQKITLKK
jgi:hypothetical protein